MCAFGNLVSHGVRTAANRWHLYSFTLRAALVATGVEIARVFLANLVAVGSHALQWRLPGYMLHKLQSLSACAKALLWQYM